MRTITILISIPHVKCPTARPRRKWNSNSIKFLIYRTRATGNIWNMKAKVILTVICINCKHPA